MQKTGRALAQTGLLAGMFALGGGQTPVKAVANPYGRIGEISLTTTCQACTARVIYPCLLYPFCAENELDRLFAMSPHVRKLPMSGCTRAGAPHV